MLEDELKVFFFLFFSSFFFFFAFFYAMNNNAIEHLLIYLLFISQYVWFTRFNLFFFGDKFLHHGDSKKNLSCKLYKGFFFGKNGP
jgi:hypothetical protein